MISLNDAHLMTSDARDVQRLSTAERATGARHPVTRTGPAAVALLSVVVLTACGRSAAQDAPAVDERTAVRSAPVERAMVSRPITASGTVAPKDEIALSFKIGGVIERIAVNAGETVRAGAVLAALDLREINALLSKARSAAAKAERDLARARRLYADSVVTLVQLQDAETAAEMAAADLQSADFNRRYA
ncbi:MAG: hypothetical protein ACRELT_06060, partial [Longimicrobiales bacterium]